MGIIKCTEPTELFKVEQITYDDYLFDAEDDNDDDAFNAISPQEIRVKSRRRAKNGRWRKKTIIDTFNEVQLNSKSSIHKNMGSRKLRRLENARLLLSLVDQDEICHDWSDMLPETISAFSKLLMDQEKMQSWNEFIEKSEQEQDEFLNELNGILPNSGGRILGGRGRMNEKYGSNYSEEACFSRMDRRFRTFFREKQPSLETVDQLETELNDYFLISPDGVFIKVLENSLNRLLLHAVAQYMSLKSKTLIDTFTPIGCRPDNHQSPLLPNLGITILDNSRQTHVKNSKPFFIPPRETLATYLRKKRHQRRDHI